MSIEIVTTGLKNIVEDGNVDNLEGTLRAYLKTQAHVGVIYDFWLSTKDGKLSAWVKADRGADFIMIPLCDKVAA